MKLHNFASVEKSRKFWMGETSVENAFISLEKAELELIAHRKGLSGWQRMVDVFDHVGVVDEAVCFFSFSFFLFFSFLFLFLFIY